MNEVIIWKPLYKLFHWGIALCILLAMFWLEDDPHAWAGYLALALVILRILSEFFIKSPKYANRLAKMIYFSVWTMVAALAVTGWMLQLDDYWGDERLQSLHENLSHLLLALIVVHLAGLFKNAAFDPIKKWKGMFP